MWLFSHFLTEALFGCNYSFVMDLRLVFQCSLSIYLLHCILVLIPVQSISELLLNRADSHTFQSTYPEVEGHLKVLYTAVTRCIDRLFFAETEDSVSGDAFLRFMTSTESVQEPGQPKTLSIATRNKIGDIENMAMTEDEVRCLF